MTAEDKPHSEKSRKVAIVLCLLGLFFLGGIHYLYVGRYLRGGFYFITFGVWMAGTIVDLYHLLRGEFTDVYGLPLR
jgi:TM2 domain-containing membrane protein YozV